MTNHERLIAVVMLAYGFDVKEIVELTNISETNIRVWKHRDVDAVGSSEKISEYINEFKELYSTINKVMLQLMPFSKMQN